MSNPFWKWVLLALGFVLAVILLEGGLLIGLIALIVYASPHWLQHYLGSDTQTTANYAFTSGPGPMMLAVLSLTGVILMVWRSLNCHIKGCLGIGRYTVAGQYKTCRHHHPNPEVREGLRHHHVLAAHRKFVEGSNGS